MRFIWGNCEKIILQQLAILTKGVCSIKHFDPKLCLPMHLNNIFSNIFSETARPIKAKFMKSIFLKGEQKFILMV